MVKSKLKFALDRYKGRDHAAEQEKKKRKAAEKKKRVKNGVKGVNGDEGEWKTVGKDGKFDSEDSEDDDAEKEVPELIPADAKLAGGGQEGGDEEDKEEEDEEDEEEEDKEEEDKDEEDEEDEDKDEDEDEEDYSDISLSDIQSENDLTVPDLIPHQRLTINNTSALKTAHSRIALPLPSLPFSEHLTITSSTPTGIKDIHDDLSRELAFYTQALFAANQARKILLKEGAPFSRPADYFAEMVKTDEHMGKIKQSLLDEAADRKASQDARRQRDLRKFGKQVQVAKLQEREKQKKETLEKINALKRSRSLFSHSHLLPSPHAMLNI